MVLGAAFGESYPRVLHRYIALQRQVSSKMLIRTPRTLCWQSRLANSSDRPSHSCLGQAASPNPQKYMLQYLCGFRSLCRYQGCRFIEGVSNSLIASILFARKLAHVYVVGVYVAYVFCSCKSGGSIRYGLEAQEISHKTTLIHHWRE